MELAKLMLASAYVRNGGRFRRQCGGIAIGSIPNQQVANLVLALDEWDHMEEILRDDHRKAEIVRRDQARGVQDGHAIRR